MPQSLMKFPYWISKPSKLNDAYFFRRPIWNQILNPVIQFFKLVNASSRFDFKLRKSPRRTSLIVWATLEFPTTENPNFNFLHSLAVWTRAPRPEESTKSIFVRSITNGSSFPKLFLTKVLNCFSEKASSCPLKVKTIIFVFTSRFPLNETVSFWKSSMIYSSKINVSNVIIKSKENNMSTSF